MTSLTSLNNKIAEATRDLIQIKAAHEWIWVKTKLSMSLSLLSLSTSHKRDSLSFVIAQVHDMIMDTNDIQSFLRSLVDSDNLIRRYQQKSTKIF